MMMTTMYLQYTLHFHIDERSHTENCAALVKRLCIRRLERTEAKHYHTNIQKCKENQTAKHILFRGSYCL